MIAQLVKNLSEMQETLVNSWVGKILCRKDRLPSPVFLGFPCSLASKESASNAGDLGWEDPLEKGKTTHSSILVWRILDCIDHGVAKSQRRLSNFHLHFHVPNTEL